MLTLALVSLLKQANVHAHYFLTLPARTLLKTQLGEALACAGIASCLATT